MALHISRHAGLRAGIHKDRQFGPRLKAGVTGMVLLVVSAIAHAEASIGQVAFVKGAATIRHVSGAAVPAQFGAELFAMDTIETAAGEIKLLFNDKTLLILGPASKVLITEHVYNPRKGERRTLYDIARGTVRAIVDQAGKLRENDVRLQTPTAVAGIRGTDAGVRTSGAAARFVCFDGAFEAAARSNPAGAVMVRSGEWTEVSGPTPSRPAPVTPAVMRQFSEVLGGESVKDVLNQAGAEALAAPPAATTDTTQTPQYQSAPPTESPQETPQSPQQEQPPTPQYLPGGTTNTPSDAGGSTPVSVPLTFPS